MNRRRTTEETNEDIASPERRQHGAVELVPTVVSPTWRDGQRGLIERLDTLTMMERRGSITASMRRAGEDFRNRFALAQLDPLRALDLSRLSLGDKPSHRGDHAPGLRAEVARTSVWRAVSAVGGISSPAGSCLWHVVGWERSLKEWAQEQGWAGRRVSQEAASGILIAALGALETHFR